jgi:hypothetical protein
MYIEYWLWAARVASKLGTRQITLTKHVLASFPSNINRFLATSHHSVLHIDFRIALDFQISQVLGYLVSYDFTLVIALRLTGSDVKHKPSAKVQCFDISPETPTYSNSDESANNESASSEDTDNGDAESDGVESGDAGAMVAKTSPTKPKATLT